MTVIMFILEGGSWILDFQGKVGQFAHYKWGGLGYIVNWVLGIYVPELVSIGILILLMEAYHRLLSLDELKLDTRSVLLYELKFLPVFLSAYFFFIPFTVGLRFLIRQYPDYAPQVWDERYAPVFYTFTGYRLYMVFMFIVGYILLNVSLVMDFMLNLKKASPADSSVLDSLAGFATSQHYPYMVSVEAREGKDKDSRVIDVKDCYLFETEQGRYYADHKEGRMLIDQTLAELENRLDPDLFFRGNRHYIINLDYLESHTYWDKGKYVLKSKGLPSRDLVMPRARLQSLKEALERNGASATT